MSGAAAETVAFAMTLHAGQEGEYQRRHDAIWPELVAALREAGVLDYRIFLHGLTLFAVMTRRSDHGLAALADTPVMRRWWAMMADIMDTNADGSPVVREMPEVFRLA